MADLSITAANVRNLNTGAANVHGIAGEAITIGQVVYRSTTTQKFLKADSDSTQAVSGYGSTLVGIAMTEAKGDNQAITVAPTGAKINVGATTASGVPYVVSNTAGGIAPYSDLGSADYNTVLFVGTGTAEVTLNVIASGSALA